MKCIYLSQVRPLIDLSDPGTVTLGMLGTAALGTVAYALMGYSETPGLEAEKRTAVNNFERFGAEHFLTDFSSYRTFVNGVIAKAEPAARTHRRKKRSWHKLQRKSASYPQYGHSRINSMGHQNLWPMQTLFKRL